MSSQPTTTNVQFRITRRGATSDERSAERLHQVEADNAVQRCLQLQDRVDSLEAQNQGLRMEVKSIGNAIAALASGAQVEPQRGVEFVSVRAYHQYTSKNSIDVNVYGNRS